MSINFLPPNTPYDVAGYKEPLRQVKGGYGFYGTVAYDKTKEYTQCHICGYFFRGLGHHIVHNHKMPIKEYKEEYGLTARLSLSAPIWREHLRQQTWLKLTPKQRAERIAKLKSKPNRGNRGTRKSLQRKNLEGRCPDQLIQKIINLTAIVGHVPTTRDCVKVFGGGWQASIVKTFGSWNNAIKIAGLKPNEVRAGSTPRYSEVQAVAMLRDFKEQHGREPYLSDIKDGVLPDESVYRRLFGTWSKAKERVFSNA